MDMRKNGNSSIYDYSEVNPATEDAVIDVLASVFNPIAYMSIEDVRKNVEFACPGGFSEEDRTMSIELGDFIMNHFSVIYFALLSSAKFRENVCSAVREEIALNEMNQELVPLMRQIQKRKDERPAKQSKGNYVIDFSVYNDDFCCKFYDIVSASFEKTAEYDDYVGILQEELTMDNKYDIGLIASNFMLLYRALAKNEQFSDEFVSFVSDVKKELGIA